MAADNLWPSREVSAGGYRIHRGSIGQKLSNPAIIHPNDQFI